MWLSGASAYRCMKASIRSSLKESWQEWLLDTWSVFKAFHARCLTFEFQTVSALLKSEHIGRSTSSLDDANGKWNVVEGGMTNGRRMSRFRAAPAARNGVRTSFGVWGALGYCAAVWACLVWTCVAVSADEAEPVQEVSPSTPVAGLEVFPTSIRFDTVGQNMSVLVGGRGGNSDDGSEAGSDGTARWDLTRAARISVADDSLVEVDGNTVRPIARPGYVLPPVTELSFREVEVFDLSRDFQLSATQNAPWSLSSAGLALKPNPNYGRDGDFPQAVQPMLVRTGRNPAPAMARAVDPAVSKTHYDLPHNCIFGHSPANVTWTASRDGYVRVRGSAWMPRDLNRKVPLSLVHIGLKKTVFMRNVVIPDRDANDDKKIDGPTSKAPFSLHGFLDGLGANNPLDAIPVRAGDTIELVAAGGDFFGLNFSVTYLEPENVAGESGTVQSTEVIVEADGHRVTIPVEVATMLKPEAVSFKHGVLVALSKQDCNMGACHANPNGKGGFRLSLRGYDAASDYETIAMEDFGRRINPSNPRKSLLLKKPMMDVPHGGGHRLRRDEPAFDLLVKWIEQGATDDRPGTPDCVALEVRPERTELRLPLRDQQLHVLAHFSDGSVRDVTKLVLYSTSDPFVASVDKRGLVRGLRRGESAITARYLEHMKTVPFVLLEDVPDFAWSNPPVKNYIDERVDEKLRLFQINASDLCTDGEFIRRVHLDIVGTLPGRDVAARFLEDTRPDKRERLVDGLLESPEYSTFWALKWGDLLRLQSRKLSKTGVQKLHRWLVRSFALNMPYDQFARALLTSNGSTFDSPPANYYRATVNAGDSSETTCQVFMGVKLQCAKCHNHPFERWTQENYYGIQAFFNRVGKKPGPRKNELVIFNHRGGEVTHPRHGTVVKPWLPSTGDQDIPNHRDRREVFTEWLVSSENPFFARVEVNRIWGELLGRGIVEPADDFRESNPPTNPGLLNALARDFVDHGFDRKHIIRTILRSRTYQLSARTHETNDSDEKYFSHATPRVMNAEQLLDAIGHVTEVGEKFSGLPAHTRATELPSPDFPNDFLMVFGKPPRDLPCACERMSSFGLSQALHMINGPVVQSKIADKNNVLRKLIAEGKDAAGAIEALYLSALARRPSATEMQRAVEHVSAQKSLESGLEDVCWALLNTKEFLFQH